MLGEKIKQLLKLSGGKVIISEGNLKDSYVVMALDEYLQDFEQAGNKQQESDPVEGVQGLTNEELLDRINTDIDELRSRKVEQQAVDNFESEDEDVKYETVH